MIAAVVAVGFGGASSSLQIFWLLLLFLYRIYLPGIMYVPVVFGYLYSQL